SSAYDSVRQRVVVFGGDTPTSTALNDTWEWDGKLWLKRRPSGALPPPRYSHAMTFDVARGGMVGFGGVGASGAGLHDTWEWDGEAWTERLPTHVPGPGWGLTLTFDPSRNVSVLFASTGAWDYGPVKPATVTVSLTPGCTSGPSPILDIRPHQAAWL